jgi:hypothetical protein
MVSAIFSSQNVISSSKTKETSFAPIDNSLDNLAQLRLRTSIHTRFTSFGASHVLRNINNVICEFRPPKR